MDYADFFEEVTDYREAGRCLHELSNILLLVLCWPLVKRLRKSTITFATKKRCCASS